MKQKWPDTHWWLLLRLLDFWRLLSTEAGWRNVYDLGRGNDEGCWVEKPLNSVSQITALLFLAESLNTERGGTEWQDVNFTNRVLSQNDPTIKITMMERRLMETEGSATHVCWLLRRSQLRCWLSVKSAKLIMNQTWVQLPLLPTRRDAGWCMRIL